MTGVSETADTRVIARAGLWSVFALVLSLAWEIAHVRLYTLWDSADRMTIAWSVLHCSLGDVVIALTLFALAGFTLRQKDWPVLRPIAGSAIVIIGAMAFTVLSEWFNVYEIGSWAYTANMPMIFGIGLSPLLQWLILPPLMTVTYRALWPRLFDRRSSSASIPLRILRRSENET